MNKLKDLEPKCALCGGTEEEVTKLVLVHKLYMCSDCCKEAKKLMDADDKEDS